MRKLILVAFAAIAMASCQKKQQFKCTCYLYGQDVGTAILEEKDFVDAYDKCKARERQGGKDVTCITK